MAHCVEDVADLIAAAPAALKGLVLAIDPDTSERLAALDIAHLTPFDLVAVDEWPRYRAFESAALGCFDQYAHVEAGGLNTLGVARYRLTGAHRRMTWVSFLMRRAIERLAPARLITFAGECGHGLDQPPAARRAPLFDGLARAAAARADVRIDAIRRPDATAAFVDHVAARNRAAPTPIDVDAALRGRPYILFQSNGDDLTRQAPLLRAAQAGTGALCVQAYSFATDAQLSQARDAGGLLWNERALLGGGHAALDPRAAQRARTRLLRAARRNPAAHDLFASPHTRSHVDFLFGDYSRSVGAALVGWRRFFEARPPVALIANYHAPIVDAAVAAGVPTLTLTHGLMMIGQTAWYQTLPNCDIAAISARHAQALAQAGIDPARAPVLGDPYADALRAQADAVSAGAPSEVDPERRQLRARLGVRPDQKLIALCTGSLGMPAKTSHAPIADFAHAFRGLAPLCEMIRRRPQWRFAIKRHPRFDHHAAHARAFAGLPADQQPIGADDAPLSDLARAADAVVVWNVVTSALVEASLWRRPTYLHAESLVWHDHAAWATDGWPRTMSHPELERELERVFADEAYAARRARQVRRAADAFLVETPSVDRCLGWLETAAAGALAS